MLTVGVAVTIYGGFFALSRGLSSLRVWFPAPPGSVQPPWSPITAPQLIDLTIDSHWLMLGSRRLERQVF
jgi:hypothetical protein